MIATLSKHGQDYDVKIAFKARNVENGFSYSYGAENGFESRPEVEIEIESVESLDGAEIFEDLTDEAENYVRKKLDKGISFP